MNTRQTERHQRGFTLVELMIVVGILGVLAAMAIPAYRSYLVRSQVVEGLEMASAAKASVAEYFAENGDWPATNTDIGLGAPAETNGTYVSSLRVVDGGIELTFGNEANREVLAGQTVSLVPGLNVNGDVIWRCGSAPDPSAWEEISATGATTTVEGKYLPSECR